LTISTYEFQIAKNEKLIQDLIDEGRTSESNKNKKEIEKCNTYIEDLKKEMNIQMKHTDNVIKFIESKRNTILKEVEQFNIREITKYFIQVRD
jgi:hypothetical protein